MDLIERTQAALEGTTGDGWLHAEDNCGCYTVTAKPDLTLQVVAEHIGSEHDAEFIAAARTLVPELLDALIEARREVNDLSGAQADADELFQKVQELEAKVRRLEGDS